MRKNWSNSGVSEVVGTILILLMTVILFAAVILWVATIPTPQATIRLDMDGQFSPIFDADGNWDGVNVTVVHRGGETLFGFRTIVFFTVERGGALTTEVLKTRGVNAGLPYGVDGPNENWSPGERWMYTNYSVLQDDKITMTVIDTIRSIIVWSELLRGVVGTHPPLFVEKWADRLPNTPSLDIPQTGKGFGIFARVLDPDGDLNRDSVYLYLAFLSGTSQQRPPLRMYDDGTNGDVRANDGIFSHFDASFSPNLDWDGGIVLLNATDFAGHKSTSRFILPVEEGPPTGLTFIGGFNGTWNATLGNIPRGGSGPLGDYGYGIYNQSGRPSGNDTGGEETRIFINFDNGNGDDRVVVIARSTVMRNAFRINTFILYDQQGNKIFPMTKEYDSVDPTKNTPAFTQTAVAPYYEFTYEFVVTGLAVGTYPVFFQIKDNAGNPPLTVNELIFVTSDFRPPTFPRLDTFRDPDGDGVLTDLEPTDSFLYSERLYIRLTFADRDSDPTFVSKFAGDVEVQDVYARYPVKRRPGNEPVSNITLWDDSWGAQACPQQPNACYVLNIDLIRKNQDPWTPGINWYTLRIRLVMDEGLPGTPEVYQLLSKSVEITTPASTLDIITTTEVEEGPEGTGTFWFENGNYWIQHIVHLEPEEELGPLALATGDLNGDTLVDVVVGTAEEDIRNIFVYYNENFGRSFRRQTIAAFEEDKDFKAQALDICDLDSDGDGDIVAGVRDTKGANELGVIVYWNDGGWTPQQLSFFSQPGRKAEVNAVVCGDINQDGRPDIVSGDKRNQLNYFRSNVAGAFLAPDENGDFPPLHPSVFDDPINFGTTNDDVLENSLRLAQMEGIAHDLNPESLVADDTVDVVVRGHAREVWLYTVEITDPVLKTVAFHKKILFSGLLDRIHSLDVGDFNGDDIIDVAVGVDAGRPDPKIYRVRNNGLTPSGTDPDDCNHNCLFAAASVMALPHTARDPTTGGLLDTGLIPDLAVGDMDADGDMDIVFIGKRDNEGVGNLLWFRNDGDGAPWQWTEILLQTEVGVEQEQQMFAVELAYIDL